MSLTLTGRFCDAEGNNSLLSPCSWTVLIIGERVRSRWKETAGASGFILVVVFREEQGREGRTGDMLDLGGCVEGEGVGGGAVVLMNDSGCMCVCMWERVREKETGLSCPSVDRRTTNRVNLRETRNFPSLVVVESTPNAALSVPVCFPVSVRREKQREFA